MGRNLLKIRRDSKPLELLWRNKRPQTCAEHQETPGHAVI